MAATEGFNYFVSHAKVDQVITAGSNAPGAPITAAQKIQGSSPSPSQLWTMKEAGDTHFYLVSNLGSDFQITSKDDRSVVLSSFGSMFKHVAHNDKVLFIDSDTDLVLTMEEPNSNLRLCKREGHEGSPKQQWNIYPPSK